jgi:2-amino-4-hydroxy-6-hydroxymethyldihydropteridine diphosphokinase
MKAWIGLGSNQDEPEFQLCSALERINQAEEIEVIRTSGFYRTAPWGRADQSAFINAVAIVETSLAPAHLMNALLKIEQQMGRKRSGDRWGPRCIDLDLLTYNETRLTSPELELPHPRMHLRAFVLQPVLELDAAFVIPGIGPAADLLASLEDQEVQWLGAAELFCQRMNNE